MINSILILVMGFQLSKGNSLLPGIRKAFRMLHIHNEAAYKLVGEWATPT